MDWSDICDLRAWLRESSSFHNSNNVFFTFLFICCWETLITTFLQSETQAEISRWAVLQDLKEISADFFEISAPYLEPFCHYALHPCVLDVNVTSPLSFALCNGNCLDVFFFMKVMSISTSTTLRVFYLFKIDLSLPYFHKILERDVRQYDLHFT